MDVAKGRASHFKVAYEIYGSGEHKVVVGYPFLLLLESAKLFAIRHTSVDFLLDVMLNCRTLIYSLFPRSGLSVW